MNRKVAHHRLWKLLGWSIVAAVLFILTLLPLHQTLLNLDDGLAFAQTIPPPGDGPPDRPPGPPVGTPTPTPLAAEFLLPAAGLVGPPVCSAGCVLPLPPDMPVVNVEYLDRPPAGIPPLTGEGVIVRVPATLPITPALASIPVPSGVITEPVGLIPFDFGPLAFRELGTLVVPTEPDQDLIVRIQILPKEAVPIPIQDPGIIPLDWFVDPHFQQFELGYGAPIPILAPGVTETNYERYATAVGLPTTPIPPPDASTAGVVATLPFTGTTINVEAVFDLTLYDGETGEQISIHLPELLLVRCFERLFEPYTPVLLRADEVLNRYDLPVQAHDRLSTSILPERTTAYLLDTSTTFVVATIAGDVPPPLVPGQPSLPLNPAAVISTVLQINWCDCTTSLPPGLQRVIVEYLSAPPAGIPPLTGGGVVARIPAAVPVTPPLATIPVPSGVITEPVGLVLFDFRPIFRANGTLIVPADPARDLIARIQVLSPETAPIPVRSTPEVIPRDWYADPHPLVAELGYGAPIPILSPGVIETNYARYATKVGLPATPIPPPDAATAGVLETLPLEGDPIKVEAVFDIDLYYADTGEEISIHLPELILGGFCFEQYFSPYTPVLLRANEINGRYDIPVQKHQRTAIGDLHENLEAYLLETSTFVIATISGEVRPPIAPGQQLPEVIPPAAMPAGLPNTGDASGIPTLSWGLLLIAVGFAAVLVIRFYYSRW